jgi:hypothetical protein
MPTPRVDRTPEETSRLRSEAAKVGWEIRKANTRGAHVVPIVVGPELAPLSHVMLALERLEVLIDGLTSDFDRHYAVRIMARKALQFVRADEIPQARPRQGSPTCTS